MAKAGRNRLALAVRQFSFGSGREISFLKGHSGTLPGVIHKSIKRITAGRKNVRHVRANKESSDV